MMELKSRQSKKPAAKFSIWAIVLDIMEHFRLSGKRSFFTTKSSQKACWILASTYRVYLRFSRRVEYILKSFWVQKPKIIVENA